MPYGKGDPKLLPNFGSSDYLLGLLAGRQMIFSVMPQTKFIGLCNTQTQYTLARERERAEPCDCIRSDAYVAAVYPVPDPSIRQFQ